MASTFALNPNPKYEYETNDYSVVYEQHKNSKDISPVTFDYEGDLVEHIKWCRKNFGQRGDGWDFIKTAKKVQIRIWSSRLLTMYTLWKR